MAKTATRDDQLARDYIDRLILESLPSSGTARLSEAVEKLKDLGISQLSLRAALLTQPDKFVQRDRRWMPAYRALSSEAPLLGFLESMIRAHGAAISLQRAADECASLYRRIPEFYLEALPRIAEQSGVLFCTESGWLGLRDWLFHVEELEPQPYEWALESERERAADDALFYNGLSREAVEPYLKAGKGLPWSDDPTGAVVKMIKKLEAPIDNRAVGFVAWYSTLDPDPRWVFPYSPVALFDAVLQKSNLIFAGEAAWHDPKAATEWKKKGLAALKKLEKDLPEEEAQPLEIRGEEAMELVDKILTSREIVSGAKLLEERFEVRPDSKTFADDLNTLVSALLSDGRIQWLGYDRFGRPEHIPPYVLAMPAVLQFPVPSDAINPETEEPFDPVLSEDAFAKPLLKEMRDPRAQDVLDEEPPVMLPAIPNSIRCVLKSHHRELGTFPLCQIPLGFFLDDPNIQQVFITDEKDRRHEVWLNQDNRLLYGLLDRFAEVEIASGAIFELTMADKPNEYRIRFTGEHDPVMHVGQSRYEDLLDLQARSEELSLFEILVEVMKRYQKGADYLTLLTEVNIVRRAPRQAVASLLTAFPCFEQHKGATVWHLDSKKLDSPMKKSLAKYLIK
ncbi:MAG: hypothetical protein HUU60_12125 [Armatimonadetes bacterium]|nr:hypothetical protein [Armatimonadota bacterium]